MIDNSCKECIHYKVCPDSKEDINGLRMCDEFLPAKQFGEWTELDVCEHVCSICGKKPYVDDVGEILSIYCPHCGARLFRKTPYGTY